MDDFSLFLENHSQSEFLRQIFDAPFDLNSKLIYADWLDENGKDDLGEYMRLACSYQAGGNVWEDHKNRRQVQKFLIGKITGRLSSDDVHINSRSINYIIDGSTAVVFLTSSGFESVNRKPVDPDRLPESVLDAATFMIANFMIHESGEGYMLFRHGLNLLWPLMSERRITDFTLNAVRSALTEIERALVHDGNIPYRMDNFNFGMLADAIGKFLNNLEYRDGNESGDLVARLRKLRSELPIYDAN